MATLILKNHIATLWVTNRSSKLICSWMDWISAPLLHSADTLWLYVAVVAAAFVCAFFLMLLAYVESCMLFCVGAVSCPRACGVFWQAKRLWVVKLAWCWGVVFFSREMQGAVVFNSDEIKGELKYYILQISHCRSIENGEKFFPLFRASGWLSVVNISHFE